MVNASWLFPFGQVMICPVSDTASRQPGETTALSGYWQKGNKNRLFDERIELDKTCRRVGRFMLTE